MNTLRTSNYDSEESFEYEVNQLAEITFFLKKISTNILIILVLSLISLPVYSIVIRTYRHNLYGFYEGVSISAWFATFVFSISGIYFLFKFNTYRNKGMIIYEELTDEIDWSSKREQFVKRPPLKARIIIKDFLKTSNLPFTTGANGQAFYLVLFFMNIIISVITQLFT